MAIQTQRSYTSSAGTLMALYRFNGAKDKNRLDHFSFQQGGNNSSVDLSKIWINNWPTSHLKGFKSYVMPQEEVQFVQNHEIFDITVPGSHFATINLTVKVSGEKNETLSLTVPERLTVVGLKKIVSRKLEIPNLSLLNLQRNGYSLDASNTLEDCGFESGTELTLDLSNEAEKKPKAQEKITTGALEMAIQPFPFTKPEDTVHKPVVTAKPETPAWRLIYPGLSLTGSCTDKTCQAFKNLFYISRKMGAFDLAEECAENTTCPACQKTLEKPITNCGFYDCMYTIKGMMEDGTKFLKEDQKTSKKSFTTFEETVNGISKIVNWKYLKITTKPLV